MKYTLDELYEEIAKITEGNETAYIAGFERGVCDIPLIDEIDFNRVLNDIWQVVLLAKKD